MNRKLKDFLIYKTPIGLLRGLYNFRFKLDSQSNEAAILHGLISKIPHPNTFVEFGFHPHEFNCIGLAKTYSGLLIDGDERIVQLARKILPSRIDVVAQFLTLESLSIVEARYPAGTLGVLSIDVDGNDYWFLRRLISIKPAIISIEYNASFGLLPVTVVYDPGFIRHKKHPSGWYHGASLTALAHLCGQHGYDLAAVSEDGINAFFVQRGLLGSPLRPERAYRQCKLRNKRSGTTAEGQWQTVKELPFVNVGVDGVSE